MYKSPISVPVHATGIVVETTKQHLLRLCDHDNADDDDDDDDDDHDDDDDDFGPVKGLIFKGMFFGLWFSGAASHFFGSPHGAPNMPHGCIGYPMAPPGSSQGPTGARVGPGPG